MKLGELAARLDCRLQGPSDLEIAGVAAIDTAQENEVTFLSNPKYFRKIKTTRAGAIILAPDTVKTDKPSLLTSNPYLAFARAISLFYSPPVLMPGIHPTATVAATASLGKECSIGAQVVIGENVHIGDHATLYPNVTIYPHARIGDQFVAHSNAVVREYCRIGNRVVLQNGAVVGADGFGFAPREDGSFEKIVQSGIVVIEDDVELGACTCVDRPSVGETRVGKGTKIDNLSQVAHGCRIGRHCILASQVGLAGSTQVGDHVTLAGQVGVAGHLSIGDRVAATAQTGIARSVSADSTVSGTPEMDSRLWKRIYFLLQQLPEMSRTIKELEAKISRLERKASFDDQESE